MVRHLVWALTAFSLILVGSCAEQHHENQLVEMNRALGTVDCQTQGETQQQQDAWCGDGQNGPGQCQSDGTCVCSTMWCVDAATGQCTSPKQWFGNEHGYLCQAPPASGGGGGSTTVTDCQTAGETQQLKDAWCGNGQNGFGECQADSTCICSTMWCVDNATGTCTVGRQWGGNDLGYVCPATGGAGGGAGGGTGGGAGGGAGDGTGGGAGGGAGSCSCALPAGSTDYSLITQQDAQLGAHSMYGGVAVGGTLNDSTPNESATVGGVSYVQTLPSSDSFLFQAGVTVGVGIPFTWSDFEALAQSAVATVFADGHEIIVATSGGTFDLYDFVPGGQGNDNGRTLVVFNTSDAVTLTRTSDGRQFGPSVLAPFSHVTLEGDAGYVDGTVIAKSFESTGANEGNLEMHAKGYSGAMSCDASLCAAPSAPTCTDITNTWVTPEGCGTFTGDTCNFTGTFGSQSLTGSSTDGVNLTMTDGSVTCTGGFSAADELVFTCTPPSGAAFTATYGSPGQCNVAPPCTGTDISGTWIGPDDLCGSFTGDTCSFTGSFGPLSFTGSSTDGTTITMSDGSVSCTGSMTASGSLNFSCEAPDGTVFAAEFSGKDSCTVGATCTDISGDWQSPEGCDTFSGTTCSFTGEFGVQTLNGSSADGVALTMNILGGEPATCTGTMVSVDELQFTCIVTTPGGDMSIPVPYSRGCGF